LRSASTTSFLFLLYPIHDAEDYSQYGCCNGEVKKESDHGHSLLVSIHLNREMIKQIVGLLAGQADAMAQENPLKCYEQK
jgi:hypothetical protein